MQYSWMQYSFNLKMPIILGFNVLEIRHILQLLENLNNLLAINQKNVTCYFYCIEKKIYLWGELFSLLFLISFPSLGKIP